MTSSVSLTQIDQEDVPILFDWINTPDLVHYNAPYKPVHESSHYEWFRDICKDPTVILFAVRTAADGRLIGTCQLHSIHPIHRTAELQIRIGNPADHSKGYGTEVVTLLVAYGFTELNLHKIYLHVLADNPRAIRVYQKVGFTQEGLLRAHAFIAGSYRDIVVMGILRED